MRFEVGQRRGGLAVEPDLAGFEECAEIYSVSRDGLFENSVKCRAIEMVFTRPGRVVSGTEKNQFCHVTNRSIARCQ